MESDTCIVRKSQGIDPYRTHIYMYKCLCVCLYMLLPYSLMHSQIVLFNIYYYELVSSKSNPNDESFAIVASNLTSNVEYHSITLICGYFYVYFFQHIRTFIWHWLHGIDYKAEEIILFTNIFFFFLVYTFSCQYFLHIWRLIMLMEVS